MAINYSSGYDAMQQRLALVREAGRLFSNLLQRVREDNKLPTSLWRHATASSMSNVTEDYRLQDDAMQLGPPYVRDDVIIFETDTQRARWR